MEKFCFNCGKLMIQADSGIQRWKCSDYPKCDTILDVLDGDPDNYDLGICENCGQEDELDDNLLCSSCSTNS